METFNHKAQAQIELFAILAEYFEENYSNALIRWTVPDGIEVVTTNYMAANLESQRHTFPRSILTDAFLRDARKTYAEIVAMEQSELFESLGIAAKWQDCKCHGNGWCELHDHFDPEDDSYAV